jgi:serine/threonine protein kinase
MTHSSANAHALREVFLQVVELDSPEKRQEFLDSACSSDARLRRDVQRLIAAHDQLQSFMEQPAAPMCDTVRLTPITERLGTVIGPYKLLEEIGEGGFGIVYLADQRAPVRRQVALKVIKPGMDTRRTVSRFRAELQALALMDHPHIARALDAGTTESGRPYFVMELVRGILITDYCDEHNLSVRERLALFVQVCHAVQHAHQRGIIHRDIKPSNVLIAEHDGRPVPKVIDFGVAKALNREIAQETAFTSNIEMIGTPLYMSPEQAETTMPDIDTRSDVYSLGVLLYELLTGSTPFEKQRLRYAAYDEIRRIIREEEPPKPSLRLSSLGDTRTLVAAHRGVDPLRLSQTVRGDLDWIVMKALEKDRARRYETPSNFAADLTRYLANEPIEARPPSTLYRFSKFARRNRLVLTTVVLVAMALIAGTGVSTWQWLRATHAEDSALQAASAEKVAKEQAWAREAETETVLKFVEARVFAAARPEGTSGGLGRNISLQKAIELALPYVDQSFAKEPLIEARLRLTLGRSFFCLGDARTAAKQEESAAAIYTRHRGPECPDTLLCTSELANSYDALGRFNDAFKIREKTLAIRKATLGAEHPDTLTSMSAVALSYSAFGRHEEARRLHEKTLALRRSRLGLSHPDTLNSMMGLANSYDALGWHADACKLHEQVVSVMTTALGPTHPDTLLSMVNLACSYDAVGRHAEARRLHDEALAIMKARLGSDHPATLHSMMALAANIDAQGRLDEALRLREQTVNTMKARLGLEHPDTLKGMHDLANSYEALGRLNEALKLREETLAVMKTHFGPDHPGTLNSMNNLANSYEGLGRMSEALMLRTETLARMRAKLGPDHPDTLKSMHNLAIAYYLRARHAESLKLNEETLAAQKAKLGPNHVDTLATMSSLGNSYEAVGRLTDALKLREETLVLSKSKLGADHPNTLRNMTALANSYEVLGRVDEALKLREETLGGMQAKLGPDHPETLKSKHNLAISYQVRGRQPDALKLYEETLVTQKAKLGVDHADTLLTMCGLAGCYDAIGRHADALKLNEDAYAHSKRKLGPNHPHTLQATIALAASEAALGRHGEALKLHKEALAALKERYGIDHPDALACQWFVAANLVALDRGAEALPLIDDCVQRAAGKSVDPLLLPGVIDLRMRHFVKIKDPAGCRQTAGMWDQLKRTDAESLYLAALYRAMTADLFRAAGQSAAATHETEVATSCLKRAVATGFQDAARVKQEKCFDSLRASDAFKRVLVELEHRNERALAKP